MRSTIAVILVALSCAAAVPGCAGTTRAHRRQNASLAMGAGAILVLAGLVVFASADDECKDIGGICPELMDKRELQGSLMVVSGVAMTITGATRIPPRDPAPATAPVPVLTPDAGAH